MWIEAVKVAVVGFTVVFAGLVMLTIGVRIMGFFCRRITKRQARAEANAKAQVKVSLGGA